MSQWTFLTNHAWVLVCIAREPGTRIRDIAQCADVTERAAHRIVTELCEAGYIEKTRIGARNFYEVHPELPLRRTEDITIGELLKPLLHKEDPPLDQAA